jgi:hypothetical protein
MAFEHNPGLAALHRIIQQQNTNSTDEDMPVEQTETEEIVKEIDEEKKTRRSRRRARKSST